MRRETTCLDALSSQSHVKVNHFQASSKQIRPATNIEIGLQVRQTSPGKGFIYKPIYAYARIHIHANNQQNTLLSINAFKIHPETAEPKDLNNESKLRLQAPLTSGFPVDATLSPKICIVICTFTLAK